MIYSNIPEMIAVAKLTDVRTNTPEKMRLLILLFLLSPVIGFSQSFEGKITYINSYRSKSSKIKDEQLNSMMGTTQEYSIKGGDYKSVFNGSFVKMQLYKNNENKSYILTSKSDSLYWEDYSKNKNPAIKYEIEKSKETVLGVICDVLIIYTPKSKTTYYYNEKYGVNPKLFRRHLYDNWYYILSKTKSLPLKTIFENEQLVFISTAVKISPLPLEDSIFDISDKRKTVKASW